MGDMPGLSVMVVGPPPAAKSAKSASWSSLPARFMLPVKISRSEQLGERGRCLQLWLEPKRPVSMGDMQRESRCSGAVEQRRNGAGLQDEPRSGPRMGDDEKCVCE